jgi:hypothetical protein
MTKPSLEPEFAVEGVEAASVRDDLDRSPEEKLNREQSPAPTKDEDGR